MELTAAADLPHTTGPTLTPEAPIEISGSELDPIGIVRPSMDHESSFAGLFGCGAGGILEQPAIDLVRKNSTLFLALLTGTSFRNDGYA